MDSTCGLLLPPSWTLFPLLDAESLFLAAQSHKFQFNLYFSFVSAGESPGQDCKSSQLHNPGAQRQKMEFPHRHQCVLALRPCRSMAEPCVSRGSWEAALGWPPPSAMARCVGALSVSTVQLGPELQQQWVLCSGQLMQPGFILAVYLLPPLIPEVDPFQPRQELPLLDTHKPPPHAESLLKALGITEF